MSYSDGHYTNDWGRSNSGGNSGGRRSRRQQQLPPQEEPSQPRYYDVPGKQTQCRAPGDNDRPPPSRKGRRHKQTEGQQRPKSQNGIRPPNLTEDAMAHINFNQESSNNDVRMKRQGKRGRPLDNTSVNLAEFAASRNSNQHPTHGVPCRRSRNNGSGLIPPALKRPFQSTEGADTRSGRGGKNQFRRGNCTRSNNPGDVLARLPDNRFAEHAHKPPVADVAATVDLCNSDSDTEGETANPPGKTQRGPQEQQYSQHSQQQQRDHRDHHQYAHQQEETRNHETMSYRTEVHRERKKLSEVDQDREESAVVILHKKVREVVKKCSQQQKEGEEDHDNQHPHHPAPEVVDVDDVRDNGAAHSLPSQPQKQNLVGKAVGGAKQVATKVLNRLHKACGETKAVLETRKPRTPSDDNPARHFLEHQSKSPSNTADNPIEIQDSQETRSSPASARAPSYIDSLRGREDDSSTPQKTGGTPSSFKRMADNMHGRKSSSTYSLYSNSLDFSASDDDEQATANTTNDKTSVREHPQVSDVDNNGQQDVGKYEIPPLARSSATTTSTNTIGIKLTRAPPTKTGKHVEVGNQENKQKRKTGIFGRRRAEVEAKGVEKRAGKNEKYPIECPSDGNSGDDDYHRHHRDDSVRNPKELSSDEDNDYVPTSAAAEKALNKGKPRSNRRAEPDRKIRGRKRTQKTISIPDDPTDEYSGKEDRKSKPDPFWADLTGERATTQPNTRTATKSQRGGLSNGFDFDDGNDDECIDDPPPTRSGAPIPNFGPIGTNFGDDLAEQTSVSTPVSKKRAGAFDNLKTGLELSRSSKKENEPKAASTSQNASGPKRSESRLTRARQAQPDRAKEKSPAPTTINPKWIQRQRKEDEKKHKQSTSGESKKQKAEKRKSPDLDGEYAEESEKRSKINGTRRLRKSPRNLRKLASTGEPETIELSSGSEADTPMRFSQEDEVLEEDAELPPGEPYDLTRIAIGPYVQTNGCKAIFNPEGPRLTLVYKQTLISATSRKANPQLIHIPLTPSTISTVNAFGSSERNLSEISSEAEGWVSLSLRKEHEQTELSKHRAYDPESDDNKKKFVVLEFPKYSESMSFTEHLASVLGENIVGIFTHDQYETMKANSESLIYHTSKQRAKKPEPRDVYKKDKLGKLLLVYPFPGDKDKMEHAADGLLEASGTSLTVDDEAQDTINTPVLPSDRSEMSGAPNPQVGELASGLDANAPAKEAKTRQRKHFVTIRVEDYQRLHPGEWLNDSLVDLWMQWISRDDTDLNSSDHHFFTSHFYTMLAEKGPESVQSWTAKKNIDIFKKKLIFIPINKDLHWSLCAVVNPGAIRLADGEADPNDALSCLIFMDSLRMHNRTTVHKKIMGWLNSEWQRLKCTADDLIEPFDRRSFLLFNPKVPYQNNTWDCGVFVCRYAYAIYQLRNRNFTFQDAGLGSPNKSKKNKRKRMGAFYQLITNGDEFNFDMDDIARFREEFKILIERLSKLYIDMKWIEKEQQKKQKTIDEEKENRLVPNRVSVEASVTETFEAAKDMEINEGNNVHVANAGPSRTETATPSRVDGTTNSNDHETAFLGDPNESSEDTVVLAQGHSSGTGTTTQSDNDDQLERNDIETLEVKSGIESEGLSTSDESVSQADDFLQSQLPTSGLGNLNLHDETNEGSANNESESQEENRLCGVLI